MGIIPGAVKIRDIVVDPEGNVVAYRSIPSPLHYLKNGRGAEFYADEVWEGVKRVTRGLTADCPHPEQIAALRRRQKGQRVANLFFIYYNWRELGDNAKQFVP